MTTRGIVCCWFGFFVVLCLFLTWHWPLMGDGALIRYVVLEIGRHNAPYRQIHDINLPGTYFLDWLVLKIFGFGATAFRIYDCCLLAVVAATMAYISGRRDRAPGFCGGCLFALFHARDGFAEVGQRDLVLALLLLLGTAVVIHVQRSGNARFMILLGLLMGLACTIKPVAVVFLLVAVPFLAEATARERGNIVRWTLLGLGIPFVSVLWFLHSYERFVPSSTRF